MANKRCAKCKRPLASDTDPRTRYHATCKRLVVLETKRKCWHKHKGEYR